MTKSGNNWIVTPDEIEIEEGFNARYNYGDIDELSNSIIANGLKIPLKGILKTGEDKFILTDGHRRHKAILLAYERGYTDIKITLTPEQKQSHEERILSMITYNSGKPFEMLEEADIYQRLINYGWTVSQIASKVGKSGQYIRDCILLMTSSTTLKKQIQKGLVSGSTVVEMLKNGNSEIVEKKIIDAIDKNDGKKVSTKHIAPKKPTKTDVDCLLTELLGAESDTYNVISPFVDYLNGVISKNALLVKIGVHTLA